MIFSCFSIKPFCVKLFNVVIIVFFAFIYIIIILLLLFILLSFGFPSTGFRFSEYSLFDFLSTFLFFLFFFISSNALGSSYSYCYSILLYLYYFISDYIGGGTIYIVLIYILIFYHNKNLKWLNNACLRSFFSCNLRINILPF